MTDDPIAEAIRQIPHNALEVAGGASDKGGARVGASVSRDWGHTSAGVEASIEQKSGWSVAGFFKRIWQ